MRILLTAAVAAAIMPSVHVVVADDRHVSYLDGTHLFPGAHYSVQIDAATHSSNASNNHQSYDGKIYGKASVFPAFIRKMQQATGRIVNLPEGYSFHDVQVQTLYLTESSVRHIDSRVEGRTPLEDSEDSLTAFYVQESTADAYFETDDGELCIPYVEGSAIYFNGGLPHQSIVKSGAVKLVGPFLLSTLESVGTTSPTPAPTSAPVIPPTAAPTTSPTLAPTSAPVVATQPPTAAPTSSPTAAPTSAPVVPPTAANPPTPVPTNPNDPQCNCSPIEYTFELKLDAYTCPDPENSITPEDAVAYFGPGVKTYTCNPGSQIPVTITAAQFIVSDENFNPVVTQTKSSVELTDGEFLSFSSPTTNPPLVGAITLTLLGVDINGVEIESRFTIKFTNDCGILSLKEGTEFSLVIFSDLVRPSKTLCPREDPTNPPTPVPTNPPTPEPSPHPTPHPTQKPSKRPTKEPTWMPSEKPVWSPPVWKAPAWNGWSKPTKRPVNAWNGWSKPAWNSWGGGWGPKPTKKPTQPPVNAWDSSWSGKSPTDWVLNGWGGDAWTNNNAWAGDGH